MSGIPGKGHDPAPMELTTKDGRKVRLSGMAIPQPIKPRATEERGEQEPPRDDPRPPHDPLHGGV